MKAAQKLETFLPGNKEARLTKFNLGLDLNFNSFHIATKAIHRAMRSGEFEQKKLFFSSFFFFVLLLRLLQRAFQSAQAFGVYLQFCISA
jgi:hypothetical protein